jgi:DNA invertase Pin-like site-specific DNA recombinase
MNTQTTQKRAAVFMRARHLGGNGRDRERDNAMITTQREQCRDTATRLNAQVIRDYAEHGGTGHLDNRPVLKLMLDELRALHDADYVIITSLDRLTRRTQDWEQVKLELAADGAELIVAGQPQLRYEPRKVLV